MEILPHLPFGSHFKRIMAVFAMLLIVCATSQAQTTYTYNPNVGGTDSWAAGTNWTPSAPVSSLDTTLFFSPTGGTFTNAVPLVDVNNNDIPVQPFQLNVLSLSGVGSATAAATASVTIQTGTLNFITSTAALAPVINLAATNGTGGVTYNVNSAIQLGNNLTIQGAGNATFNIGGAISGAFGITKTGASVVTFSGNNSYTGATSFNGGTIKISGSTGLGDGTQVTNSINFNGGTLESTAGTYDLGVNRAITLNGAGTVQTDAGVLTISGAVNTGTNLLTVQGAANTLISGTIAGSGTAGFVKAQAGTLTLSAANTYSGATVVTGGILQISGSANLGNGSSTNVIRLGGTLDSTANTYDLGTNRAITLTANGTIQSDAGTLTVSGNITNGASLLTVQGVGNTTITGTIGNGTGGLTKAQAGVLKLTAANTYTGTTAVNGGTLIAGNTLALGASTAGLSLGGGTLDLATDTSINAYNTTVTANSIIQSDRATVGAGITHTLGTLSIGAQTLTVASGTNVTSGTGTLAIGAVTITAASPTFAPTTGILTLASVTGTNLGVIFGGTSTGANTVGSIAIGTGGVTKNTAATWTFLNTNTYTGVTSISGGNTILAADNAFGTSGTLNLNTAGTIIQGSGTGTRTIGNATVVLNGSGVIVGGTQALTLSGSVVNGINGSGSVIVNNTGMTTLHGGLVLSSGAGGRALTILGTGNVTVDSAISPFATATGAQTLVYTGGGTLTLANGGSFGGVTGAGLSTLTVATGTAFGANQGNSNLKISGNYTFGTSGSVGLIIKGGDSTTTGRGTLTLVDGVTNTLTINSTLAGATVLTMGQSAAAQSVLNMEVGNSGADAITLGSGLKASVGATGVLLNITGLGGFTSGSSSLVYTLINAPGGGFTAGGGNFVLSATSGNFGGYTTASLSSSIRRSSPMAGPATMWS